MLLSRFHVKFNRALIPRALLTYFLVKCILFYNYHLSGYSYVDQTNNDIWLTFEPKNLTAGKSNCPLIPHFEIEDWRAFRHDARFESLFPDAADEDAETAAFRQKLTERGFPHESSWTPTSCNPVHNVTVVVPYRNRLHQLKQFISHIHPFLKLQKVSYRIVVVEQANSGKFNRAKLFNVGFAESQKRFPSHCYIFHDVDQLPENLENIYGCTKSPRHMCAATNSWRYLLSYDEVLGGVVSMSAKQFEQINGHSNSYHGWGGEDDDLWKRVKSRNLTVLRFNPSISSYKMIPHVKEASGDNDQLCETAEERFASDGLNDLKYTLFSFEDGIGFTYVRVDV